VSVAVRAVNNSHNKYLEHSTIISHQTRLCSNKRTNKQTKKKEEMTPTQWFIVVLFCFLAALPSLMPTRKRVSIINELPRKNIYEKAYATMFFFELNMG
jgi:hypothetical protein